MEKYNFIFVRLNYHLPFIFVQNYHPLFFLCASLPVIFYLRSTSSILDPIWPAATWNTLSNNFLFFLKFILWPGESKSKIKRKLAFHFSFLKRSKDWYFSSNSSKQNSNSSTSHLKTLSTWKPKCFPFSTQSRVEVINLIKIIIKGIEIACKTDKVS